MSRLMTYGTVFGVLALLLSSLGPSLAAADPPVAAPAALHLPIAPLPSPPPNPFYTHMAASIALGANNLTTRWNGTVWNATDQTGSANATSFGPDVEFPCNDSRGNLWVPSLGDNRITEFTPPFSTGEAASIVLGQPNFTAKGPNATATGTRLPAACTFDSHGDLWVSDFDNSRVLEFVPPFTDGQAALLVLGQSTFNGDQSGTSAQNLSRPVGLTLDSHGDLWVVDAENDRVVEFVPPFSNGMNASLVLGQSNFTTSRYGLSASNLSDPQGIDYSGGILWVADSGNDRVLGFDAPFSTGEGATHLLGQSSFTGNTATGAGAFGIAVSVSVDPRGNLWVSDFAGNRVVEFLPPFSTFENASVVVGQTNLTADVSGDNATAIAGPFGAFVGPNGALWVADTGNNRVLEFIPSTYRISFQAKGLPGTTAWSVLVGSTPYASTGTSVEVDRENGSYSWTVPAIPGYTVTPASGVASVDDGNLTVNLTMTEVTYTVTFTSSGLPGTSAWSVTLGGVAHSSPNNGTITFTEPNGTFSYVVAAVGGYNDTPTQGSVAVHGGGENVGIGFFAVPPATKGGTSTSGSSSPLSTVEELLLIIVAGIVGLMVGILVSRRRKGGVEAVPTPAAMTPPAPPASNPGSPWSEGPGDSSPPPPSAGGPPPGAV
ncbi:MAG: NHL repeat-containing protein [Thermoplasmata archaeon]